MIALSPNRFVEAVFATLRLRSSQTIDDDGHMDERFQNCLVRIEEYIATQQKQLLVPFSFRQNELHGDSPEFREALLMAGKAGIISIDNPVFRTIRLKLSSERAEQIVNRFPIPPQVLETIVGAEFAGPDGFNHNPN